MSPEKQHLPDDVHALQTMVIESHKKLDSYDLEIKNYDLENRLLRERIALLTQQLFGRKSEKSLFLDDGYKPASLFKEESADTQSEPETIEEITVPSHSRKKRGRKKLPPSLRREEIVYDLSKEEKQCACGCEMSQIGQETSERLEMRPAIFWVVRQIRPKYACKSCEGLDSAESGGSVKIAPAPLQLLPKSITTPSLLAHIMIGKFCDSLPFYRQQQQFLRLGFKLSRASMCIWAIKIAHICKPLIELLVGDLLSGPLIQIDETTIQVLKEPDRPVTSKSYMWVFRGVLGPPGKDIILFSYQPSRSGTVAKEFLEGYQGYVQTDGFVGYDFLDKQPDIVHLGCWAHVRRKFADVLKANGKKDKTKGLGKAGKALKTIRALYAIERDVNERTLLPELVYQERQEKSKPILDKFEIWLKENAPKTPPNSLLGLAYNYALKQWPRLTAYLENGILRMDNNLAENAIRPFVVGRKNWLFNDVPEGAEASAIMYSLIETAKANKLEPFQYLLYLFAKLPQVLADEEDLRKLLPQNLNPEILEEHKKTYMKREEGAVY